MHQSLNGATPTAALTGMRSAEPESQQVVQSLAATFYRRWPVFVAIVVGFMVLVGLFTLLAPKSYTASVKLIAGNNGAPSTAGGGAPAAENPTTNLPILNALLVASGVQSAETYVELFGESPVLQSVIDALHLNMSPAALKGHLDVKPVTNTNIMSISVTWNSPEMAAKVANQFAQSFVERERDLITSQATQAVTFLSTQMPSAEAKLHDTQANLAKFETQHRIADVSQQTQATITQAAAIDAKIQQVQLDQRQQQALIGSIGHELGSTSATTGNGQTVAPNPVLQQLRTQLAQAQVQLQTAQQQYTDEHPTVIGLKTQVSQLQKQIASQPATVVSNSNTVANPVYQQLSQQLAMARSAASGDAAQLSELQRQRAQIDPLLAALPAQESQLANLQRQEKLSEAVYTALQQKYNDAMVTKRTALSDVTITQAASPSEVIRKPDWRLNMAIGALLALVLGVTGVFVADFFDNTVRDDGEIERDLQLPVLANIPQLTDKDRASSTTARYAQTESYLQLVTSMRYASDKPLRTIAITSPLKGDGKSTTALNVAIALGELAAATPAEGGPSTETALAPTTSVKRPVLLIDADLRRPTLHQRLGMIHKSGLSDVLVGNAPLSAAVQRTAHPGVDVLSSGTASPNPLKLLQSQRFDEVLREAAGLYSTVIVDTSALLAVFDAAVISAKTDGTILVVSAGQTDMRSMKRALRRLEQVGVQDLVGTVVNRSKLRLDEYSDYLGIGRDSPQLEPA